jgi:hypothetical protein
MTTTTAAPKSRRRRRWHRIVVPFSVLLLFWMVTLAAHFLQGVNLTDPGTLSPNGTGAHGSSQLADRLRGRGVAIERVTSTADALASAQRGPATIFLPEPNFADPRFLRNLRDVNTPVQVVIVQPSGLTTYLAGIPVSSRYTRWATRTVAPDCSLGLAQAAGPAAALQDSYDAEQEVCYGGGLAHYTDHQHPVWVVGANDPFRNDRINEAGNAILATGLLNQHQRLIWVDLHTTESISKPDVNQPDVNLPRPEDYHRDDQDRTHTGNALLDAFPSTLWAASLLVLAAAVLLAFARARRLGPPVAEPLPVLVPAAEAVTGRGRLYDRIGARQASLTAVRAAAIARLARAVDRFAGAAPERELTGEGPATERFLALVAERSGLSPGEVRTVLFGRSVDDDDDLVASVAAIDHLVALVLHQAPNPPGGEP